MSTHITGKFKYTSWDENAYEELSNGRRLTRASVAQDLSGDIEGEGSAEWLMCYRPDKTATFVGLQRLTGRVGSREGSFVVESHGTYDGALARGRWTIVPGSVADAGVDGETSAAAVSALHHFLDAPTIGRLRGVVGRTSPATVRMVDRLVKDGYARRRAGGDARASPVELTAKGR